MSKYYYAVVDKKGQIKRWDEDGQLLIYEDAQYAEFNKVNEGEIIKRILITDLNKLLR